MSNRNLLVAAALAVAVLTLPGVLGLPARAGLPAMQPTAAAVAPVPAGLARVWFYRQFQPSEGMRTPMIFVNGAPVAASVPGTLFYRDLAPGTYTFAVETCTEDTNQASTLTLPPGSETDLEVQSLSSLHSWGCLKDDTFYIRPIPANRAQLYRPQLAYLGAR
jgi:hypothetical protein